MNEILFIIDNINYSGGAHSAAARQIAILREAGHAVDVFCTDEPTAATHEKFAGCGFRIHPERQKCELFAMPLGKAMRNAELSPYAKLRKLAIAVAIRTIGAEKAFSLLVGNAGVSEIFQEYPLLCVLSEGSVFREIASFSQCRKIQWVHIDYAQWHTDSAMSRRMTANDGKLFARFDKVVFISEHSKNGFLDIFPGFPYPERLEVTYNPLNLAELAHCKKATEAHDLLEIVTVARLDYQKNLIRSVHIAQKLKDAGCRFRWRVYGDGTERTMLEREIKKLNLEQYFILCGARNDVWAEASDADCLALFSRFEGVPTVIFEALVLGIPVAANAIAAIPEQLQNNRYGEAVPDTDEAIVELLAKWCRQPELLAPYRENLKTYHYDDAAIKNKLLKLFDRT